MVRLGVLSLSTTITLLSRQAVGSSRRILGARALLLGLRGGCTNNMSSVPALLEASAAIQLHKAGKCMFLDGSWHMAKDRDAAAEFSAERLPGARRFDIDAIKDTASDLPHMLPPVAEFEAAMGRLGISNDDHVVVYARPGSFAAPRVWHVLKTFGHHKVSVLNGGFAAWQAAGGEVETGAAVGPVAAAFRAQYTAKAVADAADVLNVVNTGSAQILDARSKVRDSWIAGTFCRPDARCLMHDTCRRPCCRGGSMGRRRSRGRIWLGATCREHSTCRSPRSSRCAPTPCDAHQRTVLLTPTLSQDGDVTTFKSPAEIRDAFKHAGVVFGSRIILTCGSGVSAAVRLIYALTKSPVYGCSSSI